MQLRYIRYSKTSGYQNEVTMNGKGNVWDYRAMIADSTLEGQFPIPTNSILFQLLQKKVIQLG